MKHITKKTLIELFIIIMPIIDILNTITGISLSLYFRGLFLGIVLYLFLFKTNSKYKKISYVFLLIIAIFSGIYIYHYYTLNGTYEIVEEITTLIKFIYLPILISSLLNVYDEEKLNINKIMLNLSLIYIALIILPTLFGISLPSYEYAKKGYSGLFYSPNELGSILAILSPFVILNIQNKDKKIINIIISVLFIITSFILGTKAPIIGLSLTLIAAICISILRLKTKSKSISNIFINISLLIVMLLIYNNSYLHYNLTYQQNNYNENNILEEINPDEVDELLSNNNYINFPVNTYNTKYIDNKLLNLIFSSRNVYMKENIAKYQNTILSKQIYGLTLGKTPNNFGRTNMSELDIIDIFIYYGIVGVLVLLLYIFVIACLTFIKFCKRFFTNIENNFLCEVILSFAIGLALSITAGHTISAPAVSTILALSIIYIVNEFKLLAKFKKVNFKPVIIVTILILTTSFIIINSSNKEYYLKASLKNNTLSFNKEIMKLNEETISYNGITDKLTYYVPKQYKNLQIIHVLRTFNDNTINYFTVINNDNINAKIDILLEYDYDTTEYYKNSLYIKGKENIQVSNTYHYILNKNDISSINKYSIKTLLNESKDYLVKDKLITKSIETKAYSSADTYIISSPHLLINSNEELNWNSFNGTYENITKNVYAKTLSNVFLDYTSSYYNDIILNNYLMSLYKYSNYRKYIWYQDWDLTGKHDNLYLDLNLNYNIAHTLNNLNINNEISSNIVNLVKSNYENNTYTTTKNGIIFSNIYDPTFKNQVILLNILIEYNKINPDKELNNIITSLLKELENPSWQTKTKIHEYYEDNKYKGEIKKEDILNELTILKDNLKKINKNTTKIEEYLKLLEEN